VYALAQEVAGQRSDLKIPVSVWTPSTTVRLHCTVAHSSIRLLSARVHIRIYNSTSKSVNTRHMSKCDAQLPSGVRLHSYVTLFLFFAALVNEMAKDKSREYACMQVHVMSATDPREPDVDGILDAFVEFFIDLSERSERHAKHSEHRLDPRRIRIVVIAAKQDKHRCRHIDDKCYK